MHMCSEYIELVLSDLSRPSYFPNIESPLKVQIGLTGTFFFRKPTFKR